MKFGQSCDFLRSLTSKWVKMENLTLRGDLLVTLVPIIRNTRPGQRQIRTADYNIIIK